MRALCPHTGSFVPRAMQENENTTDDIRRDSGGCVFQWTKNIKAIRECKSNISKYCIVCDLLGRYVRLCGIHIDLDQTGKSYTLVSNSYYNSSLLYCAVVEKNNGSRKI